MTFIPQTGTAVIRIPKTGSSALETVINAKYGAKTCLCQGHKTASEMVNELVAQNHLHTLREFVVVIRSPMDRFVSALHHLHGRKAGHNLDRAMNDALDPPEHHKVLFKPQYEYLNFLGFAPYKIFGYSTDGVGGLASYLDCEEPQDENVSVKRSDFAIEHITNHPRYDEVYSKYMRIDEALWQSIVLSNLKGFGPDYGDEFVSYTGPAYKRGAWSIAPTTNKTSRTVTVSSKTITV